MPTLAEHQQQRTLLTHLRASDDPGAQQQAEQLQTLYHDREMAGLADDVYDSAKGEGRPDAGWIRASEHPEKLREYASQLNLTDKQITELLKPGNSGFRAEIYLPDPAVLGPGYKPTVVFKGSAGEVLTPDGLRDTGSEDFIANNFPQSVGLKTDYYDRAMRLASLLKDQKLDFELAGHSLGGGMASAAAAVTGARTTTLNAAGLHPLTAQRFAEENGLQLYDTRKNVTAYQVAGEVLNDGIQQNIHRLDAFRREELGAVLKETSTILQELPHSKALLASQLDANVPRYAQPSVHAFLDRLQHGDTAQLLRELPLAAGQAQPLLAAKQHASGDGGIVDRPTRLSLREVSNFAGPALDAIYLTAQGARLGRTLGSGVAQAGQLAEQGLDASGDLTQRAAQAAAQLRQGTTQLLGAVAAQGVEQTGVVAAQGRQALGQAEAGIDRLQGQAQGEAASLGAAALRSLGGILPQGVGEHVTAQAERLEQAGAAAQQRGQHEAAQALRDAAEHAQQIRQRTHDAGHALDAAAKQVGQAEQATLTAVGTAANATFDTVGRSIEAGTAMVPEVNAVQVGAATSVVGTAAIHNPTTIKGLFNLARTGMLADKVSDSFDEATERHLMTETVVPSMDARIQGTERKARELLAPEQTAPTQTQDHPLRTGDRGTEVPSPQRPGDGKLAMEAGIGADDGLRRMPASQPLLAMGDPAHPGHPLYVDVKDRLEAKGTPLPEDRLNQVTAAMYIGGFKADWPGRVDVVNDTFYAQHTTDPSNRLHMSIAEPAPSIQESMQQVQTHTLETARQQQASAQAKQNAPTEPGPVMG
ncbi:phospholipase [Xanthomonas arboricola]|uniref:phospholipase n=2 Tax=Xanthomonas TaxID=338 RepID=UPI000E1EC942|nr:phospholipase [Xanthomonas arboricola]